jgi:hypothetical protein
MPPASGMIERPVNLAQFCGATGPPVKPALLDPRAAPLDQNNQNDNCQNAGDNLNNRGTGHNNPSFLQQNA